MYLPELPLPVAGEELRDFLDRRDRRREADPGQLGPDMVLKALEGQREEGAPRVPAHPVGLIDDHPLRVQEPLPELRRRENKREGLRRRDEDVRRASRLTLSLLGGGVTG